MVENISNLIILAVSIVFGKDVFVDFWKICYENIKHSDESEGGTRFPNGKRYDLYNFKTRLYIDMEGLAVFLYLSVFMLVVGNFFGLSKICVSSNILIDKIFSILCPFSITSFLSSFKNKIYDQFISIDDILTMKEDPELIKKHLIQNRRFLMPDEIRELNEHFYHDQTIDWIEENGFIEVDFSLRKAQDETEEDQPKTTASDQ
jgi:hypothetical protein